MSILVTEGNQSIATNILVKAFQDDPLFSAMVRKDDKKNSALKALFEELVPPCVKCKNVRINQENTAALIWWLSNQDPIGYSYLLSALLHPLKWIEIAGSLWDLLKMARFMSNCEVYHPNFQHIYLYEIGVLPECNGKGYGSKLMNELKEYADKNNYPIYLECTKLDTIPFYEKHGFIVLERVQVLSSYPYLWRMIRPIKNPSVPIGTLLEYIYFLKTNH